MLKPLLDFWFVMMGLDEFLLTESLFSASLTTHSVTSNPGSFLTSFEVCGFEVLCTGEESFQGKFLILDRQSSL